jgi:hypothetical protein
MSLLSLKFDLLKTYCMSGYKIEKLTHSEMYSSNGKNYFLIMLEKDELIIKDVTFYADHIVGDYELEDEIPLDHELIFAEEDFSSTMENRYIYNVLLSKYGESWLLLNRAEVGNNLYSIQSLVYQGKVKRSLSASVKGQT